MYVIFRSDPDLFWEKGRIQICFGEKVESGSVLGKRSNPDLFWEKVESGSVLGKSRIRIRILKKIEFGYVFLKWSGPNPV